MNKSEKIVLFFGFLYVMVLIIGSLMKNMYVVCLGFVIYIIFSYFVIRMEKEKDFK